MLIHLEMSATLLIEAGPCRSRLAIPTYCVPANGERAQQAASLADWCAQALPDMYTRQTDPLGVRNALPFVSPAAAIALQPISRYWGTSSDLLCGQRSTRVTLAAVTATAGRSIHSC